MIYDRDTLLKDLRQFVIEVHFMKANGEHRSMRCTLRPELLPEAYRSSGGEVQDIEFHQKNKDVIACWDVQQGGWRSFRIDSVEYVQNINENY